MAVIQTSLTSFALARPAPVIGHLLARHGDVGAVLSVETVSAAAPASTTGPNRAAAPGICGDVMVIGPAAVAGRDRRERGRRDDLDATSPRNGLDRVVVIAPFLPVSQVFAALPAGLTFALEAALAVALRAGTIVNW